MDLQTLFVASGLALTDLTVMLHTPKERGLRYRLADIIGTRPELFEAYQADHGPRAGKSLSKRTFTASFVARGDGGLVFAGIYAIKAVRPTSAEFAHGPLRRELATIAGAELSWSEEDAFVEMVLTDHLQDLRGRLVIAPRLTQVYVRRADRLNTPIVEITAEPIWDGKPPDWRDFVRTGADLRVLGPRAVARLQDWRGVYLIFDPTDGQRYVGSAYGKENLYGRWMAHVRGDRGITARLQDRDPARFIFSILELTSPTLPAEEVITIEHSWMQRLHTKREFGLNS